MPWSRKELIHSLQLSGSNRQNKESCKQALLCLEERLQWRTISLPCSLCPEKATTEICVLMELVRTKKFMLCCDNK
ncbi:hypothetical protein SUGI_0024200 [Cryptomeria japonica]|nr:hypothetical protein SUGI_0024200 [Cryptomeria japonica]